MQVHIYTTPTLALQLICYLDKVHELYALTKAKHGIAHSVVKYNFIT